ncbi:MAG: hypothetical protein A2W90_17060 [Bacteroidetes bacterium GWF2_42_66]|nr:MAG: hypothetical protein A2W92_15675 [Bacteroidetes bacterium GWA2_42_15]OFX97757.1 MAG: hypothetical protein A2W89_06975 [Bacteroidetes bacterium GWE2_42_39]OFY45504.1 MAG: hypothetical protein A2W90_17060 [Bacteroidetes bacterium GWF2_42_66]HAZ02851.1 hypothetical protein [Marinilabiliales bacterium]HBL73797.1 hypothetical protein [Prolixibacteraceae bacterium]
MELHILIKYIEGTASYDEKQKVENWILSEARNIQYLEKVKKIWLSVDELKELASIDVNKDWNLVEKRMTERSGKIEIRSIFKSKIIYLGRIAAVFLLGVVISGLFFYFGRENPNNKNISQARFEFNVPEGQKSDLVLPDGTKVMVNAGSKLSFPKEFSENNREVWMEGEAFFEVKKDASNPFIVHTSGINIKVLGTTFNVRAYSDEQLIETTLLEGKVLLNKDSDDKTENFVELNPSHKAIYLKNKDAKISAGLGREFQGPLKVDEILISELINTEATTSWIQGKLIFENEFFDVITNRLEKYYGVTIRIEDESLKNIRYTGTLKKVSIDQALKALQLTTSFNYKMNNTEIILTQK